MDRRNSTKPIIAGVNLNNPTETFKVVMILCLIIFVAAVLFFSTLRLKFRQIYSPRLLLIENKIFTIGTLPRSFFSWISPSILTTDDDIYTFSGIDALVFIRFLKLILKLALFTLPYGMIVLLPININGGYQLVDGLDRLSMSNIKASSSLLWAHCLAVWLYTFAIIYLTFEEWKVYIKYRQSYLKKGTSSQFAIFLQNIPEQYLDQESLKTEVEKLFPNKVYDIHIIKDLSEWEKMIKKHDKYVLKWERAKHYQETTQKTMKIKKVPCGEEYDAIDEYEKELELIQEKLKEEQIRPKGAPYTCAFVFVKSLKARSLALQNLWHTDPLVFRTRPAPAVNEILWDNLKICNLERYIRLTIGFGFVFVLVLSWAVPITFISSLTKLQSLAKELSWLDLIKKGTSKLVLNFIQGVLPVLLIGLFYLILPYILRAVARFQGTISKGDVAMMVFKCLFIFQTFNTFFIYIISGSVFQQLPQLLKNPFDLPNILAKTLPSQAGFFLNYLALVSFVGLAIELTRIWPFIYITIKLKWIAKTPRDKMEAWKPTRPQYEIMYSQALLFFLIGLSYSILSPIIIPFFVLYYAFASVVWVYQLLHVYIPEFDHGGKFWPQVFYRMLASVITFQLLMFGVFLLKHSWYAAIMVLPAILITMVYWWIMSNRYRPHGEYLSLSEAVDTKYADQRFMENVKNSYIRDQTLPDKYEVSSDSRIFEGENYVPILAVKTDSDDDETLGLSENRRLISR